MPSTPGVIRDPTKPRKTIDELAQDRANCIPCQQANFQAPSGLLTVVESVYYQTPGENPVGIDVRFSNRIPGEQPYLRKMMVGEEWQPLDTGWIKKPGIILISNRGGSRLAVTPTPEQIKADAAKTLELRIWDGIILIPPGEGLRFRPQDVSQFKMRCQLGETNIQILAVAG